MHGSTKSSAPCEHRTWQQKKTRFGNLLLLAGKMACNVDIADSAGALGAINVCTYLGGTCRCYRFVIILSCGAFCRDARWSRAWPAGRAIAGRRYGSGGHQAGRAQACRHGEGSGKRPSRAQRGSSNAAGVEHQGGAFGPGRHACRQGHGTNQCFARTRCQRFGRAGKWGYPRFQKRTITGSKYFLLMGASC